MGEQNFNPPLKWHPRSTDQAHNGSIYYEPKPGHAYAVAMQPQYVTNKQWKLYAESIQTAVNTYPAVADLVEALGELLSCANAIVGADTGDPDALEAFTLFDVARVKARSALSRFSSLEAGKGGVG